MMKRMMIVSMLLISASMMLAACGAAPDEQPESGEKTVYVGPQLVDCVGVAPQQCMQVKEDPQADYTLFYDQIEGFEFEEGYEYELRIKEEVVENPPADASSRKWTLVEVVSKTAVETAETETVGEIQELQPSAEGEVITMYVGPELVECTGVGPQTCMQVKMNPDDNYTLFYNQIEGFTFEPGNEYELLVLVQAVENPPADGSSLKYTLVEEVSKAPAAAGAATAGDTASGESPDLEGPIWTLVSYVAPDGQPADVLPDTRITAEFKDGQVSGTAGCNRYFSSFETDGSSLTIGPAGSTMMYCEPLAIMLQETAYLATLSRAASYEISGGQLHIKDEDGTAVLIFAADAAPALTDATWNLISYNNGKEAMVSVISGSEITAKFGEEGTMSGSAGCNSYSAGYETDGDSIIIGPSISTQMFCAEPEGVMDQEAQYLAALQNAAVYQIDGPRLEIRDANGSGVAYYEAIEQSALTSVPWNLISHNNGQDAMVSTIIGTEITAVFDEAGILSGSAGCNGYSASYEADGDQIQIGPAASTRKMCAQPEGIMEQENQYLMALENAAVYVIEGRRLEIRDANGSGVAFYEMLDKTAETGEGSAVIDNTVPETPETLEASAESSVPPEIADALANASYPLNYTGSGTIQLENGEFRQPAATDSAAEIVTQLTESMAVSETAAGGTMVAAILVSQTGGTGTFYDLVALQEVDGELSDPASTYLGDRIVINSLTIVEGQIVVDMVVQGPEDPFCCPTQAVVQTYELVGSELVQVSSEITGTVESQPEAAPVITGFVWKWQELFTPAEQISIDSPEKYTIEFQDDGILNVTADCNVGSGSYEIDGQELSINITSTTLALCAEGSYGDLFFQSLDSAAIYFMDGENLMIDQFADGGTMRFFK